MERARTLRWHAISNARISEPIQRPNAEPALTKPTWSEAVMAKQMISDLEKFHNSYSIAANGCWIWQKAKSRAGYAIMRLTFDAKPRAVNAHRWGYIQIVGPISSGLTLDHLCRNTACVNPTHLEPVTHRENVRRGLAMQTNEYCKRGHSMSGDNLSVLANGKRRCLACKRRSNRQQWQRHYDELLSYHREYYRKRALEKKRGNR